jgi:endo-1,4-beta-xylanase
MTKYLLYITIPSLFILASIVWLIVAGLRRSRFLKLAASIVLIEALILAGSYFYWFTPKEYPRNYLNQIKESSASLGELASSKNFYLGGAVGSTSNPHLAALVPEAFNSITPENATKWRQLLANGEIGKYDFSAADAIVNYAIERDVRVRGHTLVWGKFSGRTYPKALDGIIENASDPASELRKIMRDHITTVMTHFEGRIKTWDVVNEPMSMDGPYLDKNIYLNTLGKSYIAEAFRIAHEVDPTVQLFINEQFGNYTGEGVEVFFELLEWLIEAKVPIHGVGIEAHAIFKTHNLEEFRGFVKRITDLGLLFEVTEFDARIRLFGKADDPYQAQADYMAEYVRICIENPSCIGFTFWGLSDKHTWFDYVPPFKWMLPNDPALFDHNSKPKPAYYAIQEALKARPVHR